MEWAWFRESNVPTSYVSKNVPTGCDLRWRNKDSLSSKTNKFFFLHMIHIKQEGIGLQIGSLSFLTGRPVQQRSKSNTLLASPNSNPKDTTEIPHYSLATQQCKIHDQWLIVTTKRKDLNSRCHRNTKKCQQIWSTIRGNEVGLVPRG